MIYSIMDSDICAPAVHAGALKVRAPGSVEKIESPAIFQSKTQNGITSDVDPKADPEGAFRFAGITLITPTSADMTLKSGLPKGPWFCSCPPTAPTV